MVDIILDKDFIDGFGDTRTRIGCSIERILLNEKNTYVVNRLLLDYFTENIAQEYVDRWKDYFTYLSDNKRVASSINNTLDTKMIFSEGSKISDFVVVLSTSNSSLKENCSLQSDLAEDILFSKLLQNGNIVFRASDFCDDNEMSGFFEKLFHCSKTTKRIVIISRFAHFDCNIIRQLKTKFAQKSYWTTKKTNICRSNDLSYLKSKLGNALKVFVGNNSKIHERKLIIGDLVIEFDDDFNKIRVDESTWYCNCQVDRELSTKLFSKQKGLSRLNL